MANEEHCPSCGHLLCAPCGPETLSISELVATQAREIDSLRRTIAQLRGTGAGRWTASTHNCDTGQDEFLDEIVAQMAAVAKSVGPTIFEEMTYPRRGYLTPKATTR